jgi:DNA-binding response OmpR family regulator
MDTATQPPAPPVKILIAEDSPTQAQRLRHILERQGYEVDVAANGRLALEMAPRFRPALVISDVVMPEMDGYELSRRIKQDPDLADIPVILVTTLSDPLDVIRGLQCHADNFILKPYDERYLLNRVQFVLVNSEIRQGERAGMGVEIIVDGQKHFITADRLQILTLLLSTYEAAIQRNRELDQGREELRSLNAELRRANAMKSDFLANMSHELRTPLNSIIGFSELLKDGMLGELEAKQRGFVTDIFDAGTHLLSLINDILDLSKVEAGMLQLEPESVDVAALLQASLLVVREKASAHRIRLDTRLDAALGSMLADERKLKQIVYNLLANAVKFTPDGGTVTLRARRCARAEVTLDRGSPGRLIALAPGADQEFLAIAIEDSGVGIAEQDLAKLFEPFTQVDSSLARRQAGTGLGLSLVRRLAELHGGTVGVQSRLAAGSRFCVWLPWRSGAPVASGNTTARSAAEVSMLGVALALVIEDDDRMAELIETQLHAEGFEVMRAATAEEGLVRAAKRRPQLITLDIFLPEMDGWEFMRRLRADPKLAATPVVIVTVSDDMARGLALGARRVLQKPFARDELVAALAGLLDARPAGESVRVLVVDDNVKAVELLATLLETEGYQALRAYGGAEAIAMARAAPPDLVILDLMMPEVSGFEVARALRESEGTARVPILVLTAKDLSAEDHARLNGEVSAILDKASFNTSELLAELRRVIARRPAT